MSYLNVLPLKTAKEYLRISDSMTDDDVQITRMITSALQYIEQQTRQIMYSRQLKYVLVGGFIRVYDHPITEIISGDIDLQHEQKTLYTNFLSGSGAEELILQVGYVSPTDVPKPLIDVALEIVDILYFGKETGNSMQDISPMSKQELSTYKRFIM